MALNVQSKIIGETTVSSVIKVKTHAVIVTYKAGERCLTDLSCNKLMYLDQAAVLLTVTCQLTQHGRLGFF